MTYLIFANSRRDTGDIIRVFFFLLEKSEKQKASAKVSIWYLFKYSILICDFSFLCVATKKKTEIFD